MACALESRWDLNKCCAEERMNYFELKKVGNKQRLLKENVGFM